MKEINEITYKGKVIAHHFWNKDAGWLVVFEKDIPELEKAEYKSRIKETADRNNVIVEFK